MKTQHTPGPWVASHDVAGIVIEPGRSHYLPYVAVLESRGGGSEEERWANARLIAAAPELLDALKEAREVLAVALAWPGSEPIRQKINAALAKAEHS
jgi:hypothetical protein